MTSTADLTAIARAYEPGDEAAIVALFADVFGREMSTAFWRWRFAHNPAAQMFIDLMWSGPTLAGHYATSPVMMHGPSGPFLAALSMTTMTARAFQGQGIFQRLAEGLYARMAAADVGIVWGFPNANSHRGFVKDLGWRDIYEIPTFRLDLDRALPASSTTLEAVETFDDRADRLWERTASEWSGVLTRRDSRYLNWRYVQHPTNRYRCSVVLSGAALDGIIVWKGYGDGVDIVDLLAPDPDVAFHMVLGVAAAARAESATHLDMWLPVAHPLHGRLERIGFGIGGPVTYFGARRLGPSAPESVFDFRSWYLTMGDSDVY